jgi:hypothetical protein
MVGFAEGKRTMPGPGRNNNIVAQFTLPRKIYGSVGLRELIGQAPTKSGQLQIKTKKGSLIMRQA